MIKPFISYFRSRLQKDFKKLLEETGYITPGKKLDEVSVNQIKNKIKNNHFNQYIRIQK